MINWYHSKFICRTDRNIIFLKTAKKKNDSFEKTTKRFEKGTCGKLHHSLHRSFYFEFILLWKRTSNVNSVQNLNPYKHLSLSLSPREEKEWQKRKDRIGSKRESIRIWSIARPFFRSFVRRASTLQRYSNDARTINEKRREMKIVGWKYSLK